MKTYTATRPLYFGAGKSIAAGDQVEMSDAEARPLLESKAISEKMQPKPQNKMNPEPKNKAK